MTLMTVMIALMSGWLFRKALGTGDASCRHGVGVHLGYKRINPFRRERP